mgnify:FL=1
MTSALAENAEVRCPDCGAWVAAMPAGVAAGAPVLDRLEPGTAAEGDWILRRCDNGTALGCLSDGRVSWTVHEDGPEDEIAGLEAALCRIVTVECAGPARGKPGIVIDTRVL